METVAAPLEFVCFFRLELANGKSPRLAIQNSIQTFQGSFINSISSWFYMRGKKEPTIPPGYSASVVQLFHLLSLALDGVPIQEPLKELEKHMIEICKEDVQDHIEKLPVKMIVPMVLCFYPAFLCLILGPAMSALTMGVGSQ